MKIRTLEELVDLLNREMAWRKKELLEIKRLVDSSKDSFRETTLIRSGVAMLYAHWEGFVKAAGTAYLNYVAMRKLKYEDLAAQLVALGMRKKLNEATQSRKATIHTEVARFFLTGLSERSSLPWESAVETKSNLKSEMLKEIACVLGIDYSQYETKEKLIDEKLLRCRNEIAHGQYLLVDYEEFCDLFDEMMNLLELFRNQIDNAATTCAYQRTPP
jgi:hypothetical protein